ncbi:ABC transporter permease [Bosea sp. AS-1]|uniref:ABC transporter permease n=1 Tax=Bosea sp. AS-1 TaxID=2015316 RepID=UPI000B77B683|nr:ABC transporter permease [Bosea sp. AS-1]
MTISLRSPLGIAMLILAALAFGYLLLPILVVVAAPLGDTGYLAFPPRGLTLKWYAVALHDTRYLTALLVSLRIAVVSAFIACTLGVSAAYALTRFDFPGRRLLEAVFLSPLILPTLVLAVGLTLFFTRTGLLTGPWKLVAGHVIVCTPYVLRVSLPVLRRFDRSLEEAARNLGASPVAAFFLVVLPVVRPGIVAGTVLAFITSFDEVVLALFLAEPGAPTLPVTIYSAVQLGFEPSVAAVSGLLVLATLGFMLLYHLSSSLGRSRN